MAVVPIGGGGSGVNDFVINLDLQASQLLTTQDSLAPASAETSRIPIIEFARSVQETIDKLREQLGKDAEQENQLSTVFNQAVINRAIFLRDLIGKAILAVSEQKILVTLRNQQVNIINTQVDLYNVGVPTIQPVTPQSILDIQDLYAGIKAFYDPNDFRFQNLFILASSFDIYEINTGVDTSELLQAFTNFMDPDHPDFQDGATLGTKVGAFYFSRFPTLVFPANLDTLVTNWGDFFDPTKPLYHNVSNLDVANKFYAPFLNPGYVPPSISPQISEEDETDRVNAAIINYNAGILNLAGLNAIFDQYNAYRQGTMSTLTSAVNTFLAIASPTFADVVALAPTLNAYYRYIQGAPGIITPLNTYLSSPTVANFNAFNNALITYRNYLSTNPPNDLNRNADVGALNFYIDQYNAIVDENNAVVDQVNEVRAQLNLPPLQRQEHRDRREILPPPPTIIDGSVFLPDRDVYERVALFTKIRVDDTSIQTALDKMFNIALIFFGYMGNFVRTTEVVIKFVQFLFSGVSVLNPLGLDKVATPATPSSNPSPGIGYATTALDLSSPFVEAIISSSLLQAYFKEAQIPDSPEIINAIKVATLQLIHDQSLFAGGATVAFLADALPSLSLLPYLGIDGAAVSIVFAVEYANQVRNIFLSDVPQQVVQQILESSEAFGSISPDKQAELVGGISAAIAATIGTVSLVLIAQALGTPGLTAQLLSLLPGIQALNDNVLSPPIFADFVGNGLSATLVGNLLIGSGLDASATAEVLAAALGEGSDPDAFYNALQKALIEAGVAPGQAQNLALASTLLVLQQGNQGTLTQSELDQVLMDGVIDRETLERAIGDKELADAVFDRLNQRNEIQNSILQDSIDEDFRMNQEITNADIRANIIGEGVIRDQIQRDQITRDVIRRDTTLRDIRNSIVEESVENEDDIANADIEAKDAIDDIRKADDSADRLQIAFINQEVLKNSIEQAFIEKGIREDEAIRRAEVIVDSLKRDRENFNSRRALREAIRDVLVNEFNIERNSAALMAAGLDLGIPSPATVPLFNIGRGVLTQYEVTQDLETRIIALGDNISNEKKDELRENLRDRIVERDNSLVHIIDRSAERVVAGQNRELVDSFSREIEAIVKPNVEVFAFIDKIRDPGNSLVFSVWTSPMYAQNQPKNYKRDLDIMV